MSLKRVTVNFNKIFIKYINFTYPIIFLIDIATSSLNHWDVEIPLVWPILLSNDIIEEKKIFANERYT